MAARDRQAPDTLRLSAPAAPTPADPAPAPSWWERLAARPGSFGFHVALRRIEAAATEAPRLGTAGRPAEEPVRLGHAPSTRFHGAELAAFDAIGGRPRLDVAFFGLWGPQGPLPGHLTEYAADRARHVGDTTLAAFADIFHHRMLVLFQRAWAVAQPVCALDRPDDDGFGRRVASLVGAAAGANLARDGIGADVFLSCASLLATGNRSAEGLAAIVGEFLRVPADVEPFVGEWLDVPPASRWSLGKSGPNSILGEAVVGARVWSATHKFRIVLRPLTPADFERMLPGSPALRALASLVRLYTNDEWSWELRLVVGAEAGAGMRLGRGPRLGWTTRIRADDRVEVDLLVDPVSGRTRRIARGSPAPSPAREMDHDRH